MRLLKAARRAMSGYMEFANRNPKLLALSIPGVLATTGGLLCGLFLHDVWWSQVVYWVGWSALVTAMTIDITRYRRAERRRDVSYLNDQRG